MAERFVDLGSGDRRIMVLPSAVRQIEGKDNGEPTVLSLSMGGQIQTALSVDETMDRLGMEADIPAGITITRRGDIWIIADEQTGQQDEIHYGRGYRDAVRQAVGLATERERGD